MAEHHTIYEGDYILYRKGGKGRVLPGEYQWPEEGRHLARIGTSFRTGVGPWWTETLGNDLDPDLKLVDLNEIVRVPISIGPHVRSYDRSYLRKIHLMTPAQRRAWFDEAKRVNELDRRRLPAGSELYDKLIRATEVRRSTAKANPKAKDYFNMGKRDLVALGTAGAIKELKRRGRDASGNKVR